MQPAPVNTGVPQITGTTTQGQTLTTSNGSWSNSPTGYVYQWRKDGTNLTGATGSAYALTNASLADTSTNYTVVPPPTITGVDFTPLPWDVAAGCIS